ncbi:hypothetical protein LINPERHAP1_LOCUS42529 [Linum perenne]
MNFLLEFICFHFLIVIWLTYFGMIVWEFHLLGTF